MNEKGIDINERQRSFMAKKKKKNNSEMIDKKEKRNIPPETYKGIKYYLYIDESGILHPNSKSDYFIFAGLLVSEEHMGRLNTNYRNALMNIKSQKGIPRKIEMKASKMNHEVKRYLLSNLRRNCSQVFVVTNIRKLRPEVFKDNVNINRHKNFILSKMVEQLIITGRLEDCNELELNIDNQNIAYNAIDNLEGYLHIMFNEDNFRYMGAYDEFNIDYINFSVKYRDSSKICLVQAADLLANTKYREYELEGTKAYRFLQQNAITLHLPLARH